MKPTLECGRRTNIGLQAAKPLPSGGQIDLSP